MNLGPFRVQPYWYPVLVYTIVAECSLVNRYISNTTIPQTLPQCSQTKETIPRWLSANNRKYSPLIVILKLIKNHTSSILIISHFRNSWHSRAGGLWNSDFGLDPWQCWHVLFQLIKHLVKVLLVLLLLHFVIIPSPTSTRVDNGSVTWHRTKNQVIKYMRPIRSLPNPWNHS